MDEIQKVLIKAGRKDLVQKYYEKVSKKSSLKEKISQNPDYWNNIVFQYLKELKEHIKNSKNKMEQSFYKDRYEAQLKDFSQANEVSEAEIEKHI